MRQLRLCGLLSLGFLLSSCSVSRVPPLVRGATANGGWYGGCPRTDPDESGPLALSPELDARLEQAFPPGSDEQPLLAELNREGFKMEGACDNDPSVKSASYAQQKYLLLQTQADIYWRIDAEHKILWTEGFVYYEGF